jgi:hypothetical protein
MTRVRPGDRGHQEPSPFRRFPPSEATDTDSGPGRDDDCVAAPCRRPKSRAPGSQRALTKTVTVTVNDGQLNIAFAATVNNPEVNAIEILGR